MLAKNKNINNSASHFTMLKWKTLDYYNRKKNWKEKVDHKTVNEKINFLNQN